MELTAGQVYQHFKGNRYRIVAIARHSETLEELVIYQALYGEYGIWARPKDMFCGETTVGGKPVKRFTYVEG